MTSKKDLPLDITKKMDALLGQAGAAGRGGDVPRSIELALEAWNLMPSPKNQWDFYPQVMSKNMIDKHVKHRDVVEAKAWIETTYHMYGDPKRESIYVLFVEGDALYKLDLHDEAYLVFKRIFDLSGREWFKEEYAKYLEFYLEETIKRGT